MKALKVENLTKNFGGLQVLQSVSFEVADADKFAIIGPNGAGKTTLLNIISGQLSCTSGHIYFAGQEITRMPPHRRLQLGLTRSFQINNLFFNLTVMDNMLLAIKGAQLPHYQMLRPINTCLDLFTTAQTLLEEMNLWEFRSHLVKNLSYGDQRLIEVALALACKPKVVLLDEPTAGLSTADAIEFGGNVRRLLGDTTLIFCAHDMDLVFNLANHIMVLHNGIIVAQGNPEEVQNNPKVKEIYLGDEELEDNVKC